MYDTRRSIMVQNCYLFLCPKPQSCPMIPSPGVLSYSFWTEKENNPESKDDLLKSSKTKDITKVQNSSSKKKSIPIVQATVSAKPEFEEVLIKHDSLRKSSSSDSKASEVKHLPKEEKADTPGQITSKLLHLANQIDKHLEKIEDISKETKDSKSVELSVSPAKENPLVELTTKHTDLKKLSFDTKSSKVIKKKPETLEVHYQTPELSTSHQTSTTTHHPIMTTKPTAISFTTPSKENKIPKKAPSSNTKAPIIISSHNSLSSSRTAATMKNVEAGHLIITTQLPTKSAIHQTKSALPVTQHNPSHTSPLKSVKSTLEDGNHPLTSKGVQEADRSIPELTSPERQDHFSTEDIKDAPRNLDALNIIPGDGDKSGLVAALVFGVMFLVLIIGLVSHKVAEARRRHQYTKLDYLINGMYVDT
nr:TPA: hypothetical protein GDO54_006289 [Pyxicephalus adspersus]